MPQFPVRNRNTEKIIRGETLQSTSTVSYYGSITVTDPNNLVGCSRRSINYGLIGVKGLIYRGQASTLSCLATISATTCEKKSKTRRRARRFHVRHRSINSTCRKKIVCIAANERERAIVCVLVSLFRGDNKPRSLYFYA